MSRIVNAPIRVCCNEYGEPVSVLLAGERTSLPILARLSHWREWIGILDGESERDVWQVELSVGVCELHCLSQPRSRETLVLSETDPVNRSDSPGFRWLLHRWED